MTEPNILKNVVDSQDPCVSNVVVNVTIPSLHQNIILTRYKQCGKCGAYKPKESFNKDNSAPDKLYIHCKKCLSLKRKNVDIKFKTQSKLAKFKLCFKCKNYYTEDSFFVHNKNNDGRYSYCKKCMAEFAKTPERKEIQKKANKKFKSREDYPEIMRKHSKKWRDSDKGKINNKEYRDNNKERLKDYHSEYSKSWAQTDVGKKSLRDARQKLYYKDIEESRRKGRKYYQKRKQSLQYAINDSMSSGIYQSIKSGKDGNHWETLVDFTLEELMVHLEKQFTKGMSWSNYGKDGWEIDHVRPKSSFNFEKPTNPDFKLCWCLRNLQPLWWKDNLAKGDKINAPVQMSLLLEFKQ